MKRNVKNCNHHKAFPTIIAGVAGYMWCPDCGAVRSIIVVVGINGFKFSRKNWIYPTGKEDVLRQLEANEWTEDQS